MKDANGREKRVERVLPWLWLPIMVGGGIYLAIANGVR